ncbi:hypothetical protein CYMTET_22918, partial [Cymbomonas tetramitiformis]
MACSPILLLLIAAALPAAIALYGSGGGVLSVSSATFHSEVLQSDSLVLVEFYAPWCGHCKRLAPEWTKATEALKGVVKLVAADCDADDALAKEYSIQGFPTVKAFAGGKEIGKYEGQHTAKALVDYALKEARSLVYERMGEKPQGSTEDGSGDMKGDVFVLRADNFDELVLQSDDYWLVEFYAPWCGHCKSLEPQWASAASDLKGRAKLGAVDATVEEELGRRYNVQSFPTIIEFVGGKQNPYEGGRTSDDIVTHVENWLSTFAEPHEVLELVGQEVMDASCFSKQICIVTFLPHILDTGAAGRQLYLDALSSLGEKYKSLPWGLVWAEAGSQPNLEAAFEVGGAGYPAL